jgi:hypothetical protein
MKISYLFIIYKVLKNWSKVVIFLAFYGTGTKSENGSGTEGVNIERANVCESR